MFNTLHFILDANARMKSSVIEPIHMAFNLGSRDRKYLLQQKVNMYYLMQ
jgi:hypothetical protein